MASQQHRVVEYSQKYHIGALFEEMMGKLMTEMPDDPVRFLMSILQLKLDRKAAGSVSKSSSFPVQHRSSSPDAMRKTMPATTDWASPESQSLGKDRQYDKPWIAGAKKLKPKRSEGDAEPKLSQKSRPDWDSHTKPTVASFDELFEDAPAKRTEHTKKTDMTKKTEHTSPGFHPTAIAAWAVQGNYGADDGPRSFYRQPAMTEAELLAKESPMSKRTEKSKQTDPAKLCVTTRVRGPKVESLKHKSDLQRMIKEQKTHDSGFEEDRDIDDDTAVSLFEDIEALRKEGVTNVKQTGVRVARSSHPAQQPVEVKVGICARCARLLDGEALPSLPAKGGSYGQLPDYNTDLYFGSASRPPSARFTQSPGPFQSDDEEFESVSQVTGPRRPVWQESDNEATPRKVKHASKASNSAHDDSVKKTTSSTRGAKSVLKPAVRAPSDDEDRQSTLSDLAGGTRWQPPEYDTDGSSIFVTGKGQTKTKHYQPRAY